MKSVRTLEFKALYEKLPPKIKLVADKNYVLWAADTKHPGLNFECIDSDNHIWSVRIGAHYRALTVRRPGDRFVWFWIGTHEEYNGLL